MLSDYVTTKYILVLKSPMSLSYIHTGVYEICGTAGFIFNEDSLF